MKIRNSLAFRLTLYYALLTALSLGIFSLFLRYAISQYYYSVGSHFLHEQAESIAEYLEYLDAPVSSTGSLFAPIKDEPWVFVINHQGDYITHSNVTKLGANVSSDYGEYFSKAILSGTPGGGRLEETMVLFYMDMPLLMDGT